jgi:hypothetical protein
VAITLDDCGHGAMAMQEAAVAALGAVVLARILGAVPGGGEGAVLAAAPTA